jgi:hypothetical protein
VKNTTQVRAQRPSRRGRGARADKGDAAGEILADDPTGDMLRSSYDAGIPVARRGEILVLMRDGSDLTAGC